MQWVEVLVVANAHSWNWFRSQILSEYWYQSETGKGWKDLVWGACGQEFQFWMRKTAALGSSFEDFLALEEVGA